MPLHRKVVELKKLVFNHWASLTSGKIKCISPKSGSNFSFCRKPEVGVPRGRSCGTRFLAIFGANTPRRRYRRQSI